MVGFNPTNTFVADWIHSSLWQTLGYPKLLCSNAGMPSDVPTLGYAQAHGRCLNHHRTLKHRDFEPLTVQRGWSSITAAAKVCGSKAIPAREMRNSPPRHGLTLAEYNILETRRFRGVQERQVLHHVRLWLWPSEDSIARKSRSPLCQGNLLGMIGSSGMNLCYCICLIIVPVSSVHCSEVRQTSAAHEPYISHVLDCLRLMIV
jgi:hypothetical protein